MLQLNVKGVVHWYCFEKPFNLTACFVTRCDAECCDYANQNDGPWTALYNNVRALVIFLLAYTVSIDWRQKFHIHQTIDKINAEI